MTATTLKSLTISLLITMGALLAASAGAQAREPIPYHDAYKDGYVLVLWSESYTDQQLGSMLERIAQTGARHLTLPAYGCQTDIHANDPGPCQTRAYLLHLATLAKSHGLDVSFLPILMGDDGSWRGQFQPTDLDLWFRNYTSWIVDLARDAQAFGAQEFVVSSEMTSLYPQEDRWRAVIAAVRAVYSGPITVTVNWGDLKHGFWDAADAIGVSAYYPLSTAQDPTQQALDSSWSKLRAQILAYADQVQRPVEFTELGYPASSSAAKTPWGAAPGDHANPELQAQCFSAFRNAWSHERSLIRMNVWATEDPATSSAAGFETMGKPAEAVLRGFFADRAALP